VTIPIGESEINEKVISSPVATMTESICAEKVDDHIEIIKATYENQIAEIHENYQYVVLSFNISLIVFVY